MKRFATITLTLSLALCAPLAFAQHGSHEGHEGHAAHGESGHSPEAHGAAPGTVAHGEGAVHHGEAAEGEHHLPSINWTQFGGTQTDAHGNVTPRPVPFIAPVINFLILLGILYFAVRRVINPALSSRRAAVEAEMGEAQRLRAEAEAVLREYTDKLKGLDQEIASLKSEFIAAGERERDRLVAEARAKAERLRREGEFAIQQEVKQLRADLIREAVEAAVTSAEGTIKTSANAQDQARLADDYVSNLEKTAIAQGAKA